MGQAWETRKLPRLVEVSSLPTFWIDAIGRVQVRGPIIRITCAELRTVMGETVRMPVVELLRPREVDLMAQFQDLLGLELASVDESAMQH